MEFQKPYRAKEKKDFYRNPRKLQKGASRKREREQSRIFQSDPWVGKIGPKLCLRFFELKFESAIFHPDDLAPQRVQKEGILSKGKRINLQSTAKHEVPKVPNFSRFSTDFVAVIYRSFGPGLDLGAD